MEQGRITECFLRLHQCVEDAAYACKTDSATPREVQDGLAELEREVRQARMTVERDPESGDVAQQLQSLEAIGRRTLDACQASGKVDRRLQNYVQQAQDVIGELRQKLLH